MGRNQNTKTPNRAAANLDQVDAHLRAGRAQDALSLLPEARAGLLHDNARGVCLLRVGRVKEAIALFRRLALYGDTTDLDARQPVVVHTNFATALLLVDGNVTGCLRVLAELRNDTNPTIGRLRDFVDRWQRGLGRWRRLLFKVYGDVPAPPLLDFEPGELLLLESDAPRRTA